MQGEYGTYSLCCGTALEQLSVTTRNVPRKREESVFFYRIAVLILGYMDEGY